MFDFMARHYDETPPLSSVREVVDLLGGTGETAKKVGVSPPAVSWWLSNGCFPPSRYLSVSAAVEACGRSVDRSLFRATRDTRKSETNAA